MVQGVLERLRLFFRSVQGVCRGLTCVLRGTPSALLPPSLWHLAGREGAEGADGQRSGSRSRSRSRSAQRPPEYRIELDDRRIASRNMRRAPCGSALQEEGCRHWYQHRTEIDARATRRHNASVQNWPAQSSQSPKVHRVRCPTTTGRVRGTAEHGSSRFCQQLLCQESSFPNKLWSLHGASVWVEAGSLVTGCYACADS